jgi:hypothetical protein
LTVPTNCKLVDIAVPVATLHQWRYLETGPKAYRVGQWLRYDLAEVVAWVKRDVA